MTWITTSLGDFAPLIYGKSLPKRSRASRGHVDVYGSGGPDGKHDAALTSGPTIVIGRKGTVGKVHFSSTPCWPIDTTYYVEHRDHLLARFIYYALQSLGLNRLNYDSAVPGLKRNQAHSIQLRVPSTDVQRQIAAALGMFDDLIDNNQRRIEILEEMARLLYREWFVHFRFPGHEDVELVDSDLGAIPEEWVAGQFSDLVSESRKTVAPEEIAVGSPIVGLEHMPRCSTTLQAWDRASVVGSRRRRFLEGDILFGKIRPYFHKVVDAPVAGYSSTDAIVFRPKKEVYRHRVLAVASSDEFVGLATATSNGTKMPRANTEILMSHGIPHPTDDLEQAFNETVGPMDALRRTLAAQNRKLREARDLLLPRLVSGELDVSELDLDLVAV